MMSIPKQTLVYRPLDDLLEHNFGPREFVLEPWLPVKGTAMVSGLTGLGKTYFGLACAYAIASGGEVLGWKAPKARKVLYVDGEMNQADIQDRLRGLRAAALKDNNGDPAAALKNLVLLCDMDQETGIPDLAGKSSIGRDLIEQALKDTDAKVLMLDNKSALFRNSGSSSNDEESWIIPQEWFVHLRRLGYVVVLFHHTGKANPLTGETKQRGTSKVEDILNTSILLKPATGKKKGTSKREAFLVHFTKHRGFVPGDDFPVHIAHEKGECRLEHLGIGEKIAKMYDEEGKTQAQIAHELAMSQSAVSKSLAKHRRVSIPSSEAAE